MTTGGTDRALPGPSGRLPGVDLARALAILGMLAVHVGPTSEPGVGGTLYGLTHGRAAILFGLLAGVGVSLLVRSRTRSRARARAKLVWRAAVLLPLGLWLQPLDHGVFVILADYALLFLVAVVLLGTTDRWLLLLAGLSSVLGAVGYLWGVIHLPRQFERQAAEWGEPFAELLHRLVLSGPYPLITWLGPFLFGMWLGRRDLRDPTIRLSLIVGGAVVAVGAWATSWLLIRLLGEPGEAPGWDRLILDTPHSQMPLWLVGASGSAALVLGCCLVAADRATTLLWPLVAVGQLAFTVYVGHLLLLHWDRETLTSEEVGGASLLVLGFAVGAMILATVWRAALPRGPLEFLLNPSWGGRRKPPRARDGQESSSAEEPAGR